jgi:hypothetical protein
LAAVKAVLRAAAWAAAKVCKSVDVSEFDLAENLGPPEAEPKGCERVGRSGVG